MTIYVKHNTGEYPIFIGKNCLHDSLLLKNLVKGHQVMIISNPLIADLYLNPLLQTFTQYQCDKFLLPDGEASKNWENLYKILNQLIAQNYHRDATLIALGGGVISDITGFAASCFHRGVDYFSIPTTLLAQIDAAIGGKTAINHPLGKNLIGAFHQPKAVLIDTETLKTLPERHFRAGLAEIIKAALIKDEAFFIYLEENLPAILNREPLILERLIHWACQIKVNIVEQDEKEKNLRYLLNYGHTFGHALEGALNYQSLLHGEAVAIGMVIAAKISINYAGLPVMDFNRIFNLLERAGLPTQLPSDISLQKLLPYIVKDKKISQEQIKFIILSKIGHAKSISIHTKELARGLMIA